MLTITETEKHKDNHHNPSFGEGTVEKLIFLLYTRKKSTRIIRTRKTMIIIIVKLIFLFMCLLDKTKANNNNNNNNPN
jgi:hypothetical protein